jgi:DNA-binding transcriptional LysR family regulator
MPQTAMGQIERTRIFLEVAERRSFAEASRRLGLSRSVVTRQVADLESELGAQLLVRTTRSVSLTVAGTIFAERMRVLVRDIDRAVELVRDQQATLKGPLKLSAPLSLGMRFLPDAVARFGILYPEVTLTLDLSDRFVDILSEDYDMALRISGPPADLSTIWRKICRVPRLVAAAPAYIERHGAPAAPADLASHRCLAYTNSSEPDVWHFTERTGETVQAGFDPAFSSNNGEVIADLAAAGEGLAFLPAFILADHLAEGRLVEVLAGWRTPPVWLTAFYPPYAALPAKVAAFTTFIEDAIAAEPTLLGSGDDSTG